MSSHQYLAFASTDGDARDYLQIDSERFVWSACCCRLRRPRRRRRRRRSFPSPSSAILFTSWKTSLNCWRLVGVPKGKEKRKMTSSQLVVVRAEVSRKKIDEKETSSSVAWFSFIICAFSVSFLHRCSTRHTRAKLLRLNKNNMKTTMIRSVHGWAGGDKLYHSIDKWILQWISIRCWHFDLSRRNLFPSHSRWTKFRFLSARLWRRIEGSANNEEKKKREREASICVCDN